MVRVAELFHQVAGENARLELLGVVLTRVGSSARAIRRQAREKIVAEFGGEDVLFETVIRDSHRTAVDCRTRGQLVYEYEGRSSPNDLTGTPAGQGFSVNH
jgi:hypothetical protein